MEKEENKCSAIFKDILNAAGLTLLAVAVGAFAGAVDALFGRVLTYIGVFRDANLYYTVPFLPLAGLLILFVLKRFGKGSIEGMHRIFDCYDEKKDDIPLRMIPMAMTGTWLTHLTGGSVGREGVAVQMSCAFSYNIAKKVRLKNAKRILLVAGVAAGFAGLFRTPLAAIFFAMELFCVGLLQVEALLPAAAAAFTASEISGLLGMERFSAGAVATVDLGASNVAKLVVLGLLCAFAGVLFSVLIKKLRGLFKKLLPNAYIRIAVIGAFCAALIILLWQGRYAGASEGLIENALTGGTVFGWDFALKLILTAVCVAAGFQGGEVAPLFAIGATLGAAVSAFLGLPPAFCAAVCYAAVFGAGTNTLIAPVLVGAEIFGYEFIPCLFIVCLVAYCCNFNKSIYPQHTFYESLKGIFYKNNV